MVTKSWTANGFTLQWSKYCESSPMWLLCVVYHGCRLKDTSLKILFSCTTCTFSLYWQHLYKLRGQPDLDTAPHQVMNTRLMYNLYIQSKWDEFASCFQAARISFFLGSFFAGAFATCKCPGYEQFTKMEPYCNLGEDLYRPFGAGCCSWSKTNGIISPIIFTALLSNDRNNSHPFNFQFITDDQITALHSSTYTSHHLGKLMCFSKYSHYF